MTVATVATEARQSYSSVCYDIFWVALVSIKHNKDGWSIQAVHTRIIQVPMRLFRIDWRRSNIVAFADSSLTNQDTCQKHPPLLASVTRFAVFVTETCVSGKVCATTVDDIIGSAANTPVKVLSEDRADYFLISCTMEQLALDQ